MVESLVGRLLVASPKLIDPTFARSVICVCAHDANGALGVVINRPLEGIDPAELLPEWRALLGPEPVAYAGGPVEREAALGLGLLRADGEARWTQVAGRIGLVNLGSSPDELGAELTEMRIFLGYAGWSPGQLDAEVEDDAWFVVDATEHDPFTHEPETLWRDVLRRQGGQLAMFAYFPPKPGLN
jgi:putative transcriptional regulator